MKEQYFDKKYDIVLTILAVIFGTLYFAATIGWIYYTYTNGIKNGIFNWYEYVWCMLSLGIIHVWIYAIFKARQSRKLLYELFPTSKDYKNRLDEFDKLSIIRSRYRAWGKIGFAVLWFIVAIFAVKCFWDLDIFHIFSLKGKVGIFKVVTFIILYAIGMILNCYSYYLSMISCLFFRKIANDEKIKCECEVPWNSLNLRTLLLVASKSSISFFVVSSMYLLAVTVCLCVSYDVNNIAKWLILLFLSLILCWVSFLIVALIPKIFLNRLFKRWNYERVKEIMRQTPYDENQIEKIWSYHLPTIRLETIFGLITIIISVGSLVVSILTMYLKAIG
jgi:hypothetical protein